MSTIIQQQITIHADRQTVWEKLADFGNIYIFNPNVPTSYSTSDAENGVGATRHCDLSPMGSVEERIIDWVEGESYTIEIYDSQNMPPIDNVIATLAVWDEGEHTRVEMTMTYETKLGVVGNLVNNFVLKSQFEKTVEGILYGLKHHVETGEVIDRPTWKRVRRQIA